MGNELCALLYNLGYLLLGQLCNSQFLQIKLLQNMVQLFHGFTFGSFLLYDHSLPSLSSEQRRIVIDSESVSNQQINRNIGNTS